MLQAARSQLASFTARYDDMQERVSQLEAMANDAGRPAEDIQSLQREASMVKAEAARLENQRSSLLEAEAEAARQHAQEQARLEALNAQIEELERTMPAPRRP
jgi:chromosome segregation ATPase